MDGNKEMVSRIQGDWDTFNARMKLDKEGNKLNPIQLTGVDGSDPKAIGTKLNEIKEKARTQGQDFEIGSLYGFKIVVKTESSTSDLFDLSQNKFFVQGDSGIKYSYNNANIAADPVLASQNFLNALEKMPTLIEKYQNDTEKISKDIPVLESVLGSTWKKEEELRELKSELQTLDRKIQLSLKPIEQGEAPQEQQEQGQVLGQLHSIEPPLTTSVVSGEPSQANGQSPSIGQNFPHSAQPAMDDGRPSLPNNIHIVTIKPPKEPIITAKGFKL